LTNDSASAITSERPGNGTDRFLPKRQDQRSMPQVSGVRAARRRLHWALIAVLLIAGAASGAQQNATASIHGSVRALFAESIFPQAHEYDPAGASRAQENGTASIHGSVRALCTESICPQGHEYDLAGVTLSLNGDAAGSAPLGTVSDANGEYEFKGLIPGSYVLKATLEGFRPATITGTIASGQTLTENLVLSLAAVRQEVEVRAEAPKVSQQDASPRATVTDTEFTALPVPQQQFKNALPLVPGVVRTPEGKLNFKGEVENQGMLIVDSAQTVDPVTGSFAINIPIDAIQTLSVYKAPYDSEYGGFSGGLTSLDTKPPQARWNYALMDFTPGLRGRSGHLVGISDDTPRLVFGGPLIKDKLNFSEAFLYEVNKQPVRGLAWPHNETKTQGFDSFTNFQAILSPQHLLSAKVNVFPRRKQFADISALVPQSASSDYGQRGFSADATDSYQFHSGALLTTLFSYTKFDGYAHGQGAADMLITPDGWNGNFFNAWTRASDEEEILSVFQLPERSWHGHHALKVGANFTRRSYIGTSQSHPVQVLREDGILAERIDFLGVGTLAGKDTEVAEFVQDHWILTDRLALDSGLRLVSQSVGRRAALAPRAGFVYSPGTGGKTIIRSGGGLFYDRVPLLAADFTENPTRTVNFFDQSGAPTGTPISYSNSCLRQENQPLPLTRCQDLDTSPRNFTWNLEVDRELSSHLILRTSYLYSETHEQFVVNPLAPPQIQGGPLLALIPNGGSHYHEIEATMHYHPNQRNELNVSYVRSRARGDLNTLSNIFVPFEEPIIRSNDVTNLNSDAPNRVVAWGVFRLPWWELTFSPVLDAHTGFPYSNVDALQKYVGTPNSQRFPTFVSFDWKFYKEFHLPVLNFKKMQEHRFRLGIYYTNFTDHSNPLQVFNNVTSPDFGHFAGFQHRVAGMVFDLVE
jgi:carboxypeptidase family protein